MRTHLLRLLIALVSLMAASAAEASCVLSCAAASGRTDFTSQVLYKNIGTTSCPAGLQTFFQFTGPWGGPSGFFTLPKALASKKVVMVNYDIATVDAGQHCLVFHN